MSKLVIFNKPAGILTQFSGADPNTTLASYIDINDVYPAGRLDKDSEGLLLLTDDGKLQHKISHPDHKLAKTYWVQVEGEITREAISLLSCGVVLRDGVTKKAVVKQISPPTLWPRKPPVRVRKNIPTSWIEITIYEGKNRQVRRMTAAVGFPTLRLVRTKIGHWHLGDLSPGNYRIIHQPSSI